MSASDNDYPAPPLQWHIETLTGIEPLDAQFGVYPPKQVPDALHEALFAEPIRSTPELAAVADDPARLAPMRTYAVLDAAKVRALPERLEAAELAHRSLLAEDADDRLKHVGPWLVQLAAQSSFTRNLFTRGETHWTLWDTEPGIYLRAWASLDALWPRLHDLMRLQDEAGKRYLLRFWEPKWTRTLLTDLPNDEIAALFTDIARVIVVHAEGCADLLGVRDAALAQG